MLKGFDFVYAVCHFGQTFCAAMKLSRERVYTIVQQIYRCGSLVIVEERIAGLFFGFMLYDEELLDEMGFPMMICRKETIEGALEAIEDFERVE